MSLAIATPAHSERARQNRRADTYVRRAEAHRHLEVAAHAHAQFIEAVAAGDLAKQREVQRRLLVDRRNAHQAAHRQRQLLSAGPHQAIGLFRHDAGFLRLFAGVHLDEQLRAAPLIACRLGNRAGEIRPVHRLDHVEQADGAANLVTLKRADQMQDEIGEIAPERRPLRFRFLNPVFAKRAVARRPAPAEASRGWVLPTATSVTASAGRPAVSAAAAIRALTAERLAAMSG